MMKRRIKNRRRIIGGLAVAQQRKPEAAKRFRKGNVGASARSRQEKTLALKKTKDKIKR